MKPLAQELHAFMTTEFKILEQFSLGSSLSHLKEKKMIFTINKQLVFSAVRLLIIVD